MKNAMKKLLSVMLVVMMLLSVVPFQAFADGDAATVSTESATAPVFLSDDDDEEVTQWKITYQVKIDDGEGGEKDIFSKSEMVNAKEGGLDISDRLTDARIREVLDGTGYELGTAVGQYSKKAAWWVKSGTVINGNVTAAIRLIPNVAPEETEATEADGNIGDEAYVYFVIDEKEETEGNYVVGSVKTKIGETISKIPSANDALTRYAKVHGSSANLTFQGWYLVGTNTVANGQRVMSEKVFVTARFATKTTSLKLNTKSGVLTPAEQYIDVVIGGTYPALPTPTRTGYTFQGWYISENGVEKQIFEGTTVNSTAVPYAKWAVGDYTVTLQRYNFATYEWENIPGFTNMAVPAGSTLSTNNGLWPTNTQIKNLVKDTMDDDYNIDKGWKIADTGADFKAGSTKVNTNMVIRPRYQRSITLVAKYPSNEKKNYYTGSITVEIGNRIGTLPNIAPYYVNNDTESYTLKGWYSDAEHENLVSSRTNLSNTSKHPVYTPALGDTLYADWDVSVIVMLYFHKGTTASVSGVECYEIPASGDFNLSNLNLYKYCSNYEKYDDGVDVRSGWYTQQQWQNYLAGKPASKISTVSDIEVDKDARQLHILLIDKGTDANSYNNNNSTSDSTNYKTGDIIIAAVVIMVVSAAALAAVYYVSKKRAAK